MNYFKAFIRVVKSLKGEYDSNYFGTENIIEERLIEAENKDEVKKFLIDKYPQFFPSNKVYEKETKDTAQFFYVVIFPLYEHEKMQLLETGWKCDYCGQIYSNTYLHRPRKNERLFGDKVFCKTDDDYCINEYKKEFYKNVEMPDDECYIKKDSPNYIYKITEKATNKCYVGKTRNAPFFRWWNHLAHSSSPFGLYLCSHKLSDFTFEVLEELPYNTPDVDVFRIESEYIHKFNSIHNGFNSIISNKSVMSGIQLEINLS